MMMALKYFEMQLRGHRIVAGIKKVQALRPQAAEMQLGKGILKLAV